MTFLFLGYSIIIIMLFFFFIVNPLILVTKADFTVLYLNICPTGPKVISADEHPLHPIERVFDEKKDWLFDQSDYGQFIIDRGCSSAVNSVEIINAENNLRSSKKVRVSVSNSLSDNSWIEVLVQELPDKRDCVIRSDCDTLERLYFSFSTKIVRYVKLQVLEVYGVGGGLTKFDIYFGNSLLKGFSLTNFIFQSFSSLDNPSRFVETISSSNNKPKKYAKMNTNQEQCRSEANNQMEEKDSSVVSSF